MQTHPPLGLLIAAALRTHSEVSYNQYFVQMFFQLRHTTSKNTIYDVWSFILMIINFKSYCNFLKFHNAL